MLTELRSFNTVFVGARWMRIPSIVYASSVITAAVPMLAHVLYDDFGGTKVGPKTPDERMCLTVVYGGFLFVASWMLLDNVMCRCSDSSKSKDSGQKSTTTYVGGKQKKN